MTDLTDWINERRNIHNAATEGPWEDSGGGEIDQHWSCPTPYREVVSTDVSCMSFCYGGSARGILEDEDSAAIVDAHNTLPALLTAVEKVLKLHKPVHQVFSWQAGGTTAYDPCETCHGKAGVHECGCWADKDLVYTCAECRDDKGRDIDWPCATVRAIEGAINE